MNYLWTVDNTASLDRVFRYSLNTSGIATAVTSWTINTQNASPTGIALDPSNTAMDIWISDSGTDRVYRYANARSLTTPVLTSSFALSATNANPQGLADPPTEEAEPLMLGYRRATAATPAIASVPARTSAGSDVFATGLQPATGNSAASFKTETASNSGTSVNRAGKAPEAVARRNRLGLTLSRVAQQTAAKTPDKAVTSDAESLDGLFSQLTDNQLFWLDHRN